MTRKIIAAVTVIAAFVALAVPASAQTVSPTQDTYGGQAGMIQGGDGGGDDEAAVNTVSSDDSGGSLPFTGLELSLMLIGGAALVATGFAIRRVSRPPAAS